MSPSQLKGALQCVLHSILFNRALGPFFPKDAECLAFGTSDGGSTPIGGVPYAKLDDAHVDSLVDAFLDRFAAAMAKGDNREGQVRHSSWHELRRLWRAAI